MDHCDASSDMGGGQHAITPRSLGGIKVGVGGLKRIAGIGRGRRAGCPNARANCYDPAGIATMLQTRSRDRCPNALRDLESAEFVGSRQHDDKFLAPIASGEIRGPLQRRLDRTRYRAQAIVASLVAVDVIENLKPVDVQKDEAEHRVLSRSPAPLAIEDLVKCAPIGKSSQAVLRRERSKLTVSRRQLVLDLLAARDVADGQDETLAVGQFSPRGLNPNIRSARVAPAKAELVNSATRLQACHVVLEALPVVGMDDLNKRQRHQLFRFISKQFAAGR